MKFLQKTIWLCLFCLFGVSASIADITPAARKQLEENSLQRKVEGFYDIQRNKVSNMEFSVTNTGKTFFDEKTDRGTGIWPRGSMNCYIFGGGIWVGSQNRALQYKKDENGNFITRDTIFEYPKWDREHPQLNAKGDTIGFPIITATDIIKVRELDSAIPNKIMGITYNPRTARSFMVPGRIEDGDAADVTQTKKYRVFFALDYNSATGEPLVEESGPTWPIWDNSSDTNDVLKYDRYFGYYIYDEGLRNTATYPRGPAFISGEDIFCTFKDTDLSRYNDLGAVGRLSRKGYPQRIQYEQMIYSWGFGDYRDFVFIKYEQQNRNKDTLWDVWLSPIYDVDITLSLNYAQGARNDVTCFYGKEGSHVPTDPPDSAKATRNMAYQYSQGNMGEAGRGFGYVGFVFLESPAVIQKTKDVNKYAKPGETAILERPSDSMNFVRKDGGYVIADGNYAASDTTYLIENMGGIKVDGGIWFDGYTGTPKKLDANGNIIGEYKSKKVVWYPVPLQLGLVTFRNWPNGEDPENDEEMYQFISTKWKDGPASPGDMRYMMATGPFNLRPGDTCRTVVGLVIAATGKGGDADGTDPDLAELVRKVDFMQKVYDENFRAPAPPERANIRLEAVNNGTIIRWDSTSELSSDPYEKGLNFLGYKIYRARRLNLDTFDVNNIAGNSIYPAGKGPFGWKEIANYQLPATPYQKSDNPLNAARTVSDGPRSQSYVAVDSFMVVGPVYNQDGTIDEQRIRVLRIPTGVSMYTPWALSNIQQMHDTNSVDVVKLRNSGWYNSDMYGRITAVVNMVDTLACTKDGIFDPWSEFYTKKLKEDGIDLSKTSFWWTDPSTRQPNYLLDSVMECVLFLNPSLARINPLYYEDYRVRLKSSYAEGVKFLDTLYNPYAPVTDTNDKGKKLYHSNWAVNPNGDIEIWDTTITTDDSGRPVTNLIRVDTVYHLGTEEVTMFGSTPVLTISATILKNDWQNNWLKTVADYNTVMDTIYSYIRKGWIKEYVSADFTPSALYSTGFPGSNDAKKVIMKYMDTLTNHRTFVDIGDDRPKDAYINKSDDVEKSENLYNNVEYYYKVIAYDEGDFTQPTPMKDNEGLEGLPNLGVAYPSADRAGSSINFEVISEDREKLGGLYNFQLFTIDEQRASQIFAGDTLELEVSPYIFAASQKLAGKAGAADTAISLETNIGHYYAQIKLSSLNKKMLLMDVTTGFEVIPCGSSAGNDYVDFTAGRTGADTLIIEVDPDQADTLLNGVYYNTASRIWSKHKYPMIINEFTSGDFKSTNFCYSLGQNDLMYGTLGLKFNGAFRQFGGMYRGDSVDMMNTNVTTMVKPLYFDGISWESAEGIYGQGIWRKDSTSNRRPLNARYAANKENRASGKVTLENGTPIYSMEYYSSVYARWDNGPGVYEVEFLPGGTEDLSISWTNGGGIPKTFHTTYLNVKVTDTYSYMRPAGANENADSVEVRYPSNIQHMSLPVVVAPTIVNGFDYKRLLTPSPLNIGATGQDPNDFYRHFNLYAQGYINTRGRVTAVNGPKLFAIDDNLRTQYGDNVSYIGTQGRYYLSAISDDGDTLDFVHIFNMAGAQFVAGYSHKGRMSDGAGENWEAYSDSSAAGYGADFKAGDKIRLASYGGVSGFPEKGAKVRFAVSNHNLDAMTDDKMDQIKVVPNPYVISHQGQSTAYDAHLYFTKLPPICTIDIYSAAGDKVTTLEHNEYNNVEQKGVEMYDLLTKNGQRVQSQTLIALIKTPDGQMTTKQFSVIVGNFRVVE